MQGWFKIMKSKLYTTLYQNKGKNTSQYDAGKPFDKIQQIFHDKNTQQLGIEGSYLNIIKAVYEKSTANDERLKVFPLKNQDTSFATSFHVLEVLSRAIRQEKEIKVIQVGKVVVKLFTKDMILYLENSKDSIHTKKPIRTKK